MSASPAESASGEPDVSFVMPCYNEEETIGYTIPHLVQAFEARGHRLQLVAVDNGSTDSTGRVLHELQRRFPAVLPHRVEVNQGYGWGVLCGLPLCTAPWVGIIPADGQVDAEDVVRLFEAVKPTRGRVLGKVRRRFRMDGLQRKVISTTYNLFVRAMWPQLGSIDINGSPKILPRDALRQLGLESKGWLLDPEIMVKAHQLKLRVIELNVFARMRGTGMSHVRATTCWEFLHALIQARLLGRWQLRPADSAPAVLPQQASRP
ncbi:MAG: glycosyltransferase family 2 protein [Gemmatimonadota bacterium]|nr:glycosyltransferase family 2 protein [Gemmatimonadota bacterium]MDH5282856.1 glycosyltransferase family 2 protein [Gemmatimonadota bacterium]